MSEPIAAEIWIGGPVPRRLVEPLCTVITAERASLEWGDRPFRPKSADGLLAALLDRDGIELLYLCDDQAQWGEFENLEAFLRREELPYSRRTEGKGEFAPERLEFRPGRPLQRYVTDNTGEPCLAVAPFRKIVANLERVEQLVTTQALAALLPRLIETRQALANLLPPEVPPLPPFTIQDS